MESLDLFSACMGGTSRPCSGTSSRQLRVGSVPGSGTSGRGSAKSPGWEEGEGKPPRGEAPGGSS